MVKRRPDMYKRRLVDDEESVMELVRFLNRKCVAILGKKGLTLPYMFYCICLTTRNENLRDRPHERPILQGFATLAADSAHGSIASSFAISFWSRVV